jgi:hypothetical protein
LQWFNISIHINIYANFFVSHFFASALYLIARHEGIENSWMTPKIEPNFTSINYYGVSMYAVFTILISVGYGDVPQFQF